MKKRGILSLIIVVLLIVSINYVFAEKSKLRNENILLKIFEEIDGSFESFNVNYNGRLFDKFNDIKTLQNISEDICNNLNLKEIHIEKIEEENINKLTIYTRDNSNRDITIITYSYIDRNSNKQETTLFIDVNDNNNYRNIENITGKISSIFKKYNVEPEVTSVITGTFDGKLSEEQQIEKIDKMISTSNSEEVESLKDSYLMSVSLFSKNIDRYIYSGDKKMNLHISMKYNSYDDKTYVLIGTPIIAVAY